jgi:hypothetical protein
MTTTPKTSKTETMFLRNSPFSDELYMRDCRGNHIGTFQTVDAAKAFCRDMGYRLQISQSNGSVTWAD